MTRITTLAARGVLDNLVARLPSKAGGLSCEDQQKSRYILEHPWYGRHMKPRTLNTKTLLPEACVTSNTLSVSAHTPGRGSTRNKAALDGVAVLQKRAGDKYTA